MGEFKRVNYKVFGKKSIKSNPDVLYWKKLGVPIFLKEFGPVDYIDFSPVEPHYFAVTSSVRVQVYSPVTRLVYKNFSRFQKSAYGGSFRNDGRLLCAGGEENLVKLFNVSTKSLLRVFEGHTGPVHRCFFTIDNIHIASFSDDQTVCVWDISSEKKVVSFNEHSDYIRAGAVSPLSSDIIVSGGYDGHVKMYDKRSETVVFDLSHGSPVESVIFLPTGSIFLSAGGTEIKVWDAIGGGRLLTRLHHHHKTVTSLRLASGGTRILSGSLDRHLNIYDVATFQKIHALDYPNSILSVGISSNDETIAVGMVDGLVSVSRRETKVKATNAENRESRFRSGRAVMLRTVDPSKSDRRNQKMTQFDTYLKKFEFTKSLKAVLGSIFLNKMPHVTIGVLQELLYRNGLRGAVGGYDMKAVVPLLRFLVKYMGDYRFTRVLIDVANVVLDVYEDTISECGPEAVNLFRKLSARLAEEIELTESLLELEGAVGLIISASTTSHSGVGTQLPALKPSESARDFVVNVN